MKTVNIFEVAVRNKYRYPFNGYISTEDLWDLSVYQLDQIYKDLKSRQQKETEESLLDTRTSEDEVLQTKIDIVRYVVKTKLDEADRAAQAKERSEQRQKILNIIADKQDEDLRNKSVDELMAMLETDN